MAIYLNFDTKKTLKHLIGFIYDSVKIKYVYIIKNGQKKIFQEGDACDEYEGCNEHYVCDCNANKITTNKKIHYKFTYKPKIYPNTKLTKTIIKTLKKNPNEIYLICDNTIILNNTSGINDDWRGSDATKLELDFHDEFEIVPINGIIPLKKLIDACFRIKSHKFDFNYELYLHLW